MIDQERLDKGLYWQKAWKLVEGCTKVSPGCDNCWSEAETVMRANHPNKKIRERARSAVHLAQIPGDMTRFDGRIVLREDNLDLPLRTKQPTVFAIWNDLFHEDVPDDFRDRAYAVMALCPQHKFLVLTKRAKALAAYWGTARTKIPLLAATDCGRWPASGIPNVWHGVTVENQVMAAVRIPYLLMVPGRRFLSVEPMLKNISLLRWLPISSCVGNDPKAGFHAVLLGGESGKNARPMHPDWVRSVRDQCASAGVPFFFKQWGEWLPDNQNPKITVHSGATQAIRVGKKRAGRLLDGKTYDDLPWSPSNESS